MGRPPSDLDDYLDWQERLENFKASGLEVEVFCLREGVSRTTFYKWAGRLKDGIPESMVAEKAARERAESGEAVFVPISLKASPVEIELPNGGIVRPSVTVCVARGKRSETMFCARILLPQAQTGIAGRWASARLCWWKSSALWAHCVPGRDRSHDELFRRADLLMHDTHEYELQLRSLDGASAGGL
jgi:hypothetical protein